MLSVCCNGWRPCEVLENSSDERILGVQLFLVHLMACETKIKRTFDANHGIWQE